ncbi:M23 family metallopeptidase [Arcicella lustrica]|uniref:M23 family metallopeptidase n=1 Tax=Arcicella lustrica TaxID=2984196 RepID=A0ABU5SN88_9BACT|nr:M23 family metallopeptidase [Arcicella sp. DC25W]MEA5428708.1 M23 family metallopeptidase [Arcicella sp. DC25W]
MKLKFFLFCSLLSFQNLAQKTRLLYPKDYFLFPINPKQQNYLAGGMGDLRADHFHAGIDIKTQGREGLAVQASADAYVSEIRVQTSGYGNVVFLTHPNGYVSVYGHLREFAEPLATYVKKKRLENQTFEIQLKPAVNEFVIKKGQIIGYSGNTGGSAGPHLHFEIRDINNNILNPLNFGFTEIKDNVAPIFQQLFIKTLSTDARVNGEFGRKSFHPIKKTDGTYGINAEISAIGEIGLELLAVDKMNDTHNSNGLSCTELFVDGKEVHYFHLEQFPNAVSHDINVHTDYAYEKTVGQRIQKLFQDDGNDELPVYKTILQKGKLSFQDGKTHQITIKIWDAYENGSTLNFTIKGEKPENSVTASPSKSPLLINYNIDDNTLVIKARNLKTINSIAILNFEKSSTELPINYVKNNEAVYLWDLKKGLPKSIQIDSVEKSLNLQKTILPNQSSSFVSDKLSIIFEAKTLYDTLYLETKAVPNQVEIGQTTIPIRNPISVSFQPETKVNLPQKTSVYYTSRNQRRFLGGKWNTDRIVFKAGLLGQFTLLTDTIPPKASFVTKSPNHVAIRISDNLSGIKSFKTYLNNTYILADYDAKRALLWTVKSDSTQSFVGKLRLDLEDNQGNKSSYETDVDNQTKTVAIKKEKTKKAKTKAKKEVKSKKKSKKKKKNKK